MVKSQHWIIAAVKKVKKCRVQCMYLSLHPDIILNPSLSSSNPILSREIPSFYITPPSRDTTPSLSRVNTPFA